MSNASNPAPKPQSLGAAVERLSDKWCAIVAFGGLLALLGAAALVISFAAAVATVTMNGVFFLVAGAAEIGIGMHAQAWGRFYLWVIGGVLYLAVGVICIINPVFASLPLTLALGAALIAAGLARAYLALQLPAERSRNVALLAAGFTFLVGLICVIRWASNSVFYAGGVEGHGSTIVMPLPWDNIRFLGVLLGLDLLVHGAGWVTFGMGLRARR